MRNTVKLGVVLLVVCAISGGVLSYVHGITSKIIDARKAEEQARSMQIVLPQAQDFAAIESSELAGFKAEPKFTDVEEAYIGSAAGEVKGLVVKVAPSGYGGKIVMLVGIGSDNAVSGLEILSHSETPGLGAEVTKADWRAQFIGKGASGTLAVTKDGGEIAAVSSATISSRAVVRGVNAARELARATSVVGGAAK